MKLVCAYPGSFLDSSSALLALAACTALGEIARNGPLLIPAEGEGFTKLSVVKNLLARIPSGKESTKVIHCFCLHCLYYVLRIIIVISFFFFFLNHYFGADEGAINPNIRIPPCGRWGFSSPEEASAGPHGFCRGMKQELILHLVLTRVLLFHTGIDYVWNPK